MQDNRLKKVIEEIVVKFEKRLIDIQFSSSKTNKKITVIVAAIEPTTVKDLTNISKAINKYLEEQGEVYSEYALEVSTPGTDSPLKTEFDFQRNIGREVKVVMTEEGYDGKGVIKSCLNNILLITDSKTSQEISLSLDKIKSAKIIVKM